MPSPPAGLGTVPLTEAAHGHPSLLQDCFPGPGTYGPRGNPYTHLEERNKRSSSTRGLMDSRTAKCALPPAPASPAPCPGDMLMGWPCPPTECSPQRLSPMPAGQRPGTRHLQPAEQHWRGTVVGWWPRPLPALLGGQVKAHWWWPSCLGGASPRGPTPRWGFSASCGIADALL